jgi:hypothetical protein
MRLRALPVLDVITSEEGAAVLVRRASRADLVRLSPLGAFIREQAEPGISLQQLTVELERRFGAPPEADLEVATIESVSSLVDNGLVEWVTD